MRKLIERFHKEEEGVVLISALMFLMTVTFLAIAGIQNPKSDIQISSNDKYYTLSQQLANLAVMEAKNWLLIMHNNELIPQNVTGDSTNELFIKMTAPDGVTDFNIGGKRPCESSGGEDLCSISTAQPKIKVGTDVLGQYEWRIVSLASTTNSDITDYLNEVDNANNYNNYRGIEVIYSGQSAAMDQETLRKISLHILGEGISNAGASPSGVIARSEAIIQYIYTSNSLN